MAIERSIRINVESGRAKAELNSLAQTLKTTDSVSSKAASSIDKLEKEASQLSSAAASVSKQTSSVNKSINSIASSAAKGSVEFKSIGRSAGAAGIQIQQFVGQVQGGVSPMVALSQQAADLGIVLGAPLVGSIVGIAAAVGGPFIAALIGAEEKSELLEESLDSLSKITKITGTGVALLSNEIEILAGRSQDAALAQIASGLADAQTVILETAKNISTLSDELTGISGADVSNAVADLEELDRAGISTDSVIARLGGSLSSVRGRTNEYASAVRNLTESYGINNSQATELIRSLGEVEKTRSPEAVRDLASFLSDLTKETEFSNASLNRLSSGVNQASVQIDNAQSVTKTLEGALEDLDSALQNSESSTEAAASSLSAYGSQVSGLVNAIKIGQLELDGLNKEAFIQEQLFRLGTDAASGQGRVIRALAEDLFNLKERLEEQSESERKATAAQIAATRARKAAENQIEKQIESNNDLVESLEDRLSVALITNARDQAILTAEQKLNTQATKEQIKRVKELAGAVFDAREAARQAEEDQKKIEEAAKESARGAGTAFEDYAKDAKKANDEVEEATTRALGNLEDSLVEFSKTGKLSFKSLVDGILEDILRLQVRQNITGPLSEALGGIFNQGSSQSGGSSTGGLIEGILGGASFFARGGVIDSPTLLGTSGGSPAIGGEAGPEAVLPLTRTSGGDLGVKAAGMGSGGVVLNIVNETGEAIQQQNISQSQGPNGESVITATITKVVNSQFGSGAFDKALNTRFGITSRGF